MKKLTAKFVQSVTEPGLYTDDQNGLALKVSGAHAKSWVQRFTIKGQRRVDRGLGSLRFVSLSDARALAYQNAQLGYQGIDPNTLSTAKATITFSDATTQAHAERKGMYKNSKDHDAFFNSLQNHVFPILGNRALPDVTPSDVRNVVLAVRQKVPSLSKKVQQRINQVMKWAIAEGHIQSNPASADVLALPKLVHEVKNRPAIPYQDVPKFLMDLESRTTAPSCKGAIEFVILTAGRSKEVREAVWSEFDLQAEQPFWIVPARRMKMNRDHKVPLSSQAVRLLQQMPTFGKGSGYVFPGAKPGKPISDMALLQEAKRVHPRTTVHGFRTSFRTWAQEKTDVQHEVAEAALSHTSLSSTEASYARSDLFVKRAQLMQDWAEYVK